MSRRFGSALALASAFVLASASGASAAYTEVDMSSVVNLGFTNSWFINGPEFAPWVGTSTGNQGTGVPFSIANVPSALNGGSDNFWFGLYGGPTNQLTGSPLNMSIATNIANATHVFTLIDNTFGTAGADEYSATFTPTVGAPVTETYFGAVNTKDYNFNCGTTGCDATPGASYWLIDSSGTQWLQVVDWTLPANFGTLASISFNQDNTGIDGAIVAGITVSNSTIPEPVTLTLFGAGLVGAAAFRRRARRS